MRRIVMLAAGLVTAVASLGVAFAATAAPAATASATMHPNPIVIVDRL